MENWILNAFKKFFTKNKEEELEKGLEKTKSGFFDKLTKAVAGKSTVDISILDDLEALLIASDVGLETTIKIIDRIEERVKRDNLEDAFNRGATNFNQRNQPAEWTGQSSGGREL